MTKAEFIVKLHELKQKQYEESYKFRNQQKNRNVLERGELNEENIHFENLKKQSIARLEKIKEKYRGINHSEKQGHLIIQNNIECEIANLKIKFFEEHPEESLAVSRS